MNFLRPIHWRQGMFLQPQHFQYGELYNQTVTSNLLALGRCQSSGFIRIQLSAERLLSGYLSAEKLEVVMPSGQWLVLGKNARLADLDVRFLADQEAVTPVALALPQFTAGSSAVSDTGRDGRFMVSEDPELLPDLFDDAPDAEVERLWFNLRFLLGNEIASAEGVETLPLARIVVSGGQINFDEGYAPYCLKPDGHPSLSVILQKLVELLQFRSNRLADIARPWRLDGEAMDSAWLRDRMLHAEVVQALTVLSFRLDIQAELESLFEPLVVLAMRLSAMGGINAPDLPAWETHDPCRSFSQIHSLLSGLLEQLRSGPDSTTTFKSRQGWLEAQAPNAARVGAHSVFLVVKHCNEMALAGAASAKLAPQARIETIVSRALAGIPLTRLEKIPYGVTNSQDALVWRVDNQDPLWIEALSAGSFCLHWVGLPAEAQVSLVFFRH